MNFLGLISVVLGSKFFTLISKLMFLFNLMNGTALNAILIGTGVYPFGNVQTFIRIVLIT